MEISQQVSESSKFSPRATEPNSIMVLILLELIFLANSLDISNLFFINVQSPFYYLLKETFKMMITLIKRQNGGDVIKDLIQKYDSEKELEHLFNQTNNMEMLILFGKLNCFIKS